MSVDLLEVCLSSSGVDAVCTYLQGRVLAFSFDLLTN